MKRRYKILIGVLVFLILLFACALYLLSSHTEKAQLFVEHGNVQVNTGDGWIRATDGMKLDRSDGVRTVGDSEAVLVLYESVIIRLDADTEVKISDLSYEHVGVYQSQGSTWNKFAAISGVKRFDITTPSTVTTVRGTTFWVDMTSVGVVEGKVQVKYDGKLHMLYDGQVFRIPDENEKVNITEILPEENKQVIEEQEKIIDELKEQREREIEKNSVTLEALKAANGWTDQDVDTFLYRVDQGHFDENDLVDQAGIPIPSESVDKIVALTTEIKKEIAVAQELQSS